MKGAFSSFRNMDLYLRWTVIVPIFFAAGSIQFKCPLDQDGSSYPHPELCTEHYRCERGEVEQIACPYSFHFDIDSQKCISANNGRCPEETEANECQPNVCAGEEKVKLVPHEAICSKYYMCFDQVPIEKQCSNGLLFDAYSRKCTFPKNARCNANYCCPKQDDLDKLKFLSDPENCARYAVCYNQKFYFLYCAEDLFFNVEKQECTIPKLSNCKVNNIDCSNYSSAVRHPTKCASYYECKEGLPHYRECKPNQYFDEETRSCTSGWTGALCYYKTRRNRNSK